MINCTFLSYYLIETNTVADAVAQINAAPEFFRQAMDWAIESSYAYIGFVAGLVLVVNFFRR